MEVTISITASSKDEREAAYTAEPQRYLYFGFPESLTIFHFEQAVSAYREVLAQTSVKPMIVEAMLPLWLSGHMRGDFRLETAAFGPLLTDGISFQWPIFAEWRDRFVQAEVLPEGWNITWETMKDRRLGLRQQRIGIMAQTISALLRNRREARRDAQMHNHGLYEITADCPASKLIAAERASSLVIGDATTYPPFFPGDRSSVRHILRRGDS